MFAGLSDSAAAKDLIAMSPGSTLSDLYSPRKLSGLVKDLQAGNTLASAMGFEIGKWKASAQAAFSQESFWRSNDRGSSATILSSPDPDDVGWELTSSEADHLIEIPAPELFGWFRKLSTSDRHNLISYLLALLLPTTTALGSMGLVEIPNPVTAAIIVAISITGIALVVRSAHD